MINRYKYILRNIYEYICKFFLKMEPLKKEIVYLASFPNNMEWFEEIIKDFPYNITIAYNESTKSEVFKLKDKYNISVLSLKYNRKFFKENLSKIANSQVILADNYYPFLSAFPNRSNQHIVQVWHASGAIKKFGLEDPKITNDKEKDCHLKVYKKYTDYIVASDNMAQIFINSYGTSMQNIHMIGYPRSDLYNANKRLLLKKYFFQLNKQFDSTKPLWLYAPTYRLQDDQQMDFDFSKIANSLNVQIIEKYHPHTKKDSTKYKGDNKMLLSAVDGLITDYSSLPFDYANLRDKGKIVYFQYDLDNYEQLYGIQDAFKKCHAGKIAKNIDDLKSIITEIQDTDFKEFNNNWNQYNDGDATKKLQMLIMDWLKED